MKTIELTFDQPIPYEAAPDAVVGSQNHTTSSQSRKPMKIRPASVTSGMALLTKVPLMTWYRIHSRMKALKMVNSPSTITTNQVSPLAPNAPNPPKIDQEYTSEIK